MIYPENMQAEIVGHPNFDLALRAWVHSRPNEGEDLTPSDALKVLSIDVPVNDFPTMVVQAYVPIILREWIVSFRNHNVWARTSRVDNLSKWPIYNPTIYKDAHLDHLQSLYEGMLAAIGEGQDSFRRFLPVTYMTHLSMSMTLRSFVKMIITAQREIETVRNPLAKCLFHDWSQTLIRAANGSGTLSAVLSDLMKSYKPETILRRWTLNEPYTRMAGGFFTAGIKGVSLSLRAQLARHRPIMLQDNLLDQIEAIEEARTIETPMDIEIACTRSAAIELVRKRNCWIAQEDLWQPVTRAVNSMITTAHEVPLPCDDGRCPYLRDNELRIEGKDPNPPCPLAARLTGVPLGEAHKAAARDYLTKKPTTASFWEKEINRA